MSGLILIVGIGIVTFLILFLMFIMKDDPKQFLLRLLLLFFAVVFLLLIAKTTLDNNNNCEWLKTEELIYYQYGANFTGYHWDYDTGDAPNNPDPYLFHLNTTNNYEYVCEDNSNMTADIFYKFVNRFQYIIYIYMIMYLLYEVLVWRGLLPEGLVKRGKKKP